MGVAGWTALKKQAGGLTASRPVPDLIRPDDLQSEHPYGPWSSRGCDVWPAIDAARTGDAASLHALLEQDLNLSRYAGPLYFAVREGHVDAVHVLLEAGADAQRFEISDSGLVMRD